MGKMVFVSRIFSVLRGISRNCFQKKLLCLSLFSRTHRYPLRVAWQPARLSFRLTRFLKHEQLGVAVFSLYRVSLLRSNY
jgi:hypothetical protein